MKIYFIANARMPSEKAYGIHIAKMCEAFVGMGHEVELIVPSRASSASMQEFYGLRVPVPVVRLWSLVLRKYEKPGFVFMGLSFMLSTFLFLLFKKICGEQFLLYTVDIDSFSHTLLPLLGPTIGEMHSPKRSTMLSRLFFRRAHVVATNQLIAKELSKTFGVEPLVEPNGVDESFFNLQASPGRVALYVGRFYVWKGLEILPKAADLASDIALRVVGGSSEEFAKVFGESGRLEFAEVPHDRVKNELAQAAVLLLVGTAKNQDSNRYTAPMKVFEYLATGKPIVASKTEAFESIIPSDLVTFVPPDNPEALAQGIKEALKNPGDATARMAFAREHTWVRRAERILAFAGATDSLKP